MKNKILKTLLAVTVCASTLLGACGAKDKNDSDVAPKVDAVFSNFLALEKQANRFVGEVDLVNDSYGKVAQVVDTYALFVNEDKNFLNEIEKVWTLYDMYAKKSVWSKKVSYPDGDYDSLDKYGNEKHAPVEVSVSIVDDLSIPYVKVVTKTYQAYTDEQMQEFKENNITGSSYVEKTSTEWYSMNGAKISSTNYATDSKTLVKVIRSNSEKVQMSFGKTVAVFDKNTYALLDSWNGDVENNSALSSMESDKYVYYPNASGSVIEVKDKESLEVVATFNINYSMDVLDIKAEVLSSGDIMLQKIVQASAANYDFLYSSGSMYVNVPAKLITQRFDVETNKVENIDTDYVFVEFFTKDRFQKEVVDGSGLKLTKNVHNVALAKKITDKNIDDASSAYVFFDSALNIQYEWKALIPEQVDLTSMKALPNGNIIVNVESMAVDADGNRITRAVVDKDGNFVRYISSNENIVGENIVMIKDREVVVYDLDGNHKYTTDLVINGFSSMSIQINKAVDMEGDIIIPFAYSGGNGYITIDKISYLEGDEFEGKELIVRYEYRITYEQVLFNDSELILTYYNSSGNSNYEISNQAETTLIRATEMPSLIKAESGYTVYVQRNGETYVYSLKMI